MRSTKLPSWTERLLGLDPVPAPGHVFSVEEARLRYAYFERSNGDLEFRTYETEDLGPDAFQEGPLGGQVRDIDRFTEAVKALMDRLPAVPDKASLVLPDEWLRIAFADIDEFPRGTSRSDVLRFKLRRMVPFRVEDLRVEAAEVPALAGRTGGRRFLIGFALETLLAQLEAMFGQHDVTIGHLSNEGLSVLPLLEPVLRGGLSAVVHVSEASYTLMVTESGQPVLHRFKSIPRNPEARARLVPRELRLTRDYLRQEVKGRRLAELVLVAPDEEQADWRSRLEDAFEHSVRSMSEEWPQLPGTVAGVPSWTVASLMGAAVRGIS